MEAVLNKRRTRAILFICPDCGKVKKHSEWVRLTKADQFTLWVRKDEWTPYFENCAEHGGKK